MLPQHTDFRVYPKFRHNLWIIDDAAGTAELTVSHSKFEVPVDQANRFMQMRGACTGHNTIEQIAAKSGVPVANVNEVVNALIDADILHRDIRPVESLSEDEIYTGLVAACRIWSEQLAMTHIGSAVLACRASRAVAIGWLLETYHYVKAFPEALRAAATYARGGLRELIQEYARQETGHERYMLDVLERLGLSRREVEQSIPLVSTRLIDLLMREMFTWEPASVLLVSAIIEAEGFDADEIQAVRRQIHEHYGFAEDALDPFFEHARIDAALGHGQLFERHRELLVWEQRGNLHDMINKLHDLKHAFDVQTMEIREYYGGRPGNYVPRQYVSFFAI